MSTYLDWQQYEKSNLVKSSMNNSNRWKKNGSQVFPDILDKGISKSVRMSTGCAKEEKAVEDDKSPTRH